MPETTITIEASVDGAASLQEVREEVGHIFNINNDFDLDGTPPGPVTVRQDLDMTRLREEWRSKNQQIQTLQDELALIQRYRAHLVEQKAIMEEEL